MLFALLIHAVVVNRLPGPVTYRVPYVLAATNHILVRAKLNGSGPYNFIMDTGAPALFVAEAIAKKLGIKADAQHWGVLDRLEVEGGPVAEKVAARVEGPFQLQAMNQLALTGVNIDGVLGYNVLARYRIEIDMARPTLSWTPVSFVPPRPAPLSEAQKQRMTQPVANQKQMESMAKMAAGMFAKKPAEVVTRGFVGIEVADSPGGIVARRVLEGSPAAAAGMAPGDIIVSVAPPGKSESPVKSAASLLEQLGQLAPGGVVRFGIRRGGDGRQVAVTAGAGGL